jgi:4-hydroxybenzoate polyprenyltransferase
MRIKFVYYKKDKKDDIKVGVKSTALKFGENTFQILSLFNLV